MSDRFGEWICDECSFRAYSNVGWAHHVTHEHNGRDPRREYIPCVYAGCVAELESEAELLRHCKTSHNDTAVHLRGVDADGALAYLERHLAFEAWCEERDRG